MASLIDAAIPALLAEDPEDLERFVSLWEMPRGDDLLQEEIVSEPGAADMRGHNIGLFIISSPPLLSFHGC